MGQKVHPNGFRLGISTEPNSVWFVQKQQYANTLSLDRKIRNFFKKKLLAAQISKIQIERLAQAINVTLFSARPGVIIGKKGEDIEKLKAEIKRDVGISVQVNISEVRKPELDATLVAMSIAEQLEKRVMFRRAMKRAVGTAMRQGAKGVKVCISGRLGGAEIARSEWNREGRVPLHTLRANIDYGFVEAKTTYGIIGVKVWIFKGEVVSDETPAEEPTTQAA